MTASRRVSLACSAIALLVASLAPAVLSAPAGAADATPPATAEVIVDPAMPISFSAADRTDPPGSWVADVSCAADGACAAIGIFDGPGTPKLRVPFVVTQIDGVWGAAQPITFPVPVDLTSLQNAGYLIDCTAPGECDGAGWIGTGSLDRQAFHFRVIDGVVQRSEFLTVTVPDMIGVDTSTMSCTAPGECVIGGTISLSGIGHRPLQWTVAGGVAGPGTTIDLPSTIFDPTSPQADVRQVACPAAGSCVEVGVSYSAAGTPYVWLRSQTAGAWGPIQSLEFATGVIDPSVSRGQPAPVAIACWAAGSCTLVGQVPVAANSGQLAPFAAPITSGVLGTPQVLTSGIGLSATIEAVPTAVECSGTGECVVIGWRSDASVPSYLPPFSMAMTGGVWGTAVLHEVPAAVRSIMPTGVSCTRTGSCVLIGGGPTLIDGSLGAYAYVQRDGVWQAPVRLVGDPSVPSARMEIITVDCAFGGTQCVSVGTMSDALLGAGSVGPSTLRSSSTQALGDASVLRETVRPAITPGGYYGFTQLIEFVPEVGPTPTPTPTNEPEPIAPTFTG